MAHDIAVCVLIKVLDRECLHVREHLVSNVLQCALCNFCHDAALEQCGESTGHVDHGHNTECCKQAAEVRFCLKQQRSDVIINQGAQEEGRLYTCKGTQTIEKCELHRNIF